ncbi:hypothetical protein QLG07_07530 [Erwinia sp. V90_4]|uniref:hypothetical protein n=1 Tax=Erwinia sp. V90_4 TaxID=3044239 RepID=UPI00249E11F8|nr:hypothetical protein [Erwinia sp. V90_4]MDI3439300.1 hypothetical protein [Erwinia sp. V90_4]
MSISDTNNAKKYATIAEIAAAQAKLSADKLNNAPDYAAQAAASAVAAASSAQVAVSAESVVNELSISASESATSAAQSAAEAGSAASSAIESTMRVPVGEQLSELPESSQRAGAVPLFDSNGDVSVKSISDFVILDSEGKIPVSMIPAVALSEVFVVNSQAEMLALSAQEGDIAKRNDLGYSLVLSGEPASTLSNWIQLNDDVLAQLGLQTGATQIGASNETGSATTVQAALDSKQTKVTLAASSGSSLVGDPLDSTVSDALLKRLYIIESVSLLLSKNFSGIPDGLHVATFANRYGVKGRSEWIISSTADTTTYSLSLPGGKYANLICKSDMNYSSFDFGGTDVQNVAAVDEGNRVARAQAIVRSLSFPAGVYQIGSFNLDVDKRAFRFWGAGWDSTTLVSTTSGISMHHLGIDPRDRNRDKLHFYQEVGGFMLDGNIDGNGSSAASRSVCTAHYSEISYKSVGHRLSNVDICSLVSHWKGHTQSRTSGATVTANGVRARYNSIKLDGYIGGASNKVACSIGGVRTTLSSAAAIGDTTINVSSASGFSIYDIVEIQGGTNLEAPYIIGISGNVLTLDKPLVSAHTSGALVAMQVVGTSLTGTIEVGQVQINNCAGTQIHGNYTEESRFFITGLVESLEIHGNSIAESSPVITIDSTIDRNSSIRIVSNKTAFPITINVKDRAVGTVNVNLDLYNFPELDIQQNTRMQQPIIVNGTYYLKSLKVSRFYNNSLSDSSFTSFSFTGLNATQAISSATAIMRFSQDSSLRGYDGHTYKISASIRRASGLSGILERVGQTSLIGSTISDTTAAASRTVNNYAFYSATDGADLYALSDTGRMQIVIKGEPTGGQSITAMISGEVISVI